MLCYHTIMATSPRLAYLLFTSLAACDPIQLVQGRLNSRVESVGMLDNDVAYPDWTRRLEALGNAAEGLFMPGDCEICGKWNTKPPGGVNDPPPEGGPQDASRPTLP